MQLSGGQLPIGGFVYWHRLYLQRSGTVTDNTSHVPPVCHSDRSDSGVEESTTWDKEPTQDKTCYSGRFLDSLRSLGMTCRWVVPISLTGCIRYGASPSPGLDGVGSTPLHLYRISGYTIHRHRLLLPRGGRQIAAPTSTYHVLTLFRAQNDDKNVKNTAMRNKYIVGAAICRPPRLEYNLCG